MHKYKADKLINDLLTREIEELNEKIGTSMGDESAKNLSKHREKEQAKISVRSRTPEKFQSGDLVLIRWNPPSTGVSRKLEPKYKGPYITMQ